MLFILHYSIDESDIEIKCVIFGNIHVIHFSKKEILINYSKCVSAFEAEQKKWVSK